MAAKKDNTPQSSITIPVNWDLVGRYLVYALLGYGVFGGNTSLPIPFMKEHGTPNETKKQIMEKMRVDHDKIHDKIDKIRHKIELLDNSVDSIKDAIIKKKLGSAQKKNQLSG